MSEVQSGTIEWLDDTNALSPSEHSKRIYGEDAFQDLLESIKELGILQPLHATYAGVIVSGHRRWRAVQVAHQEGVLIRIPVIRESYASELDERRAIIEFNRYRVKTGQQYYNEGKELKEIQAERARQRQEATQLAGRDETGKPIHKMSVVENFPPPTDAGKTRDVIARTIGLGSGRQWDKLEYVAEHKPQLLNKIKPDGISIHRAYDEARREERRTAAKHSPPLPPGVFDVIIADPPWQYKNAGVIAAAEKHYSTMSTDTIAHYVDENNTEIKAKFAENAALFLWVTNPFIEDALALIATWGFQYKTNLVWVKEDLKKPGTGFYVRGRHELLFVCTRGSFVPDMTGREPIGSVIFAPVQEHSRKPDEAYEVVEKMYPDRRYLELFARTGRDNWESWGNEIPKASETQQRHRNSQNAIP